MATQPVDAMEVQSVQDGFLWDAPEKASQTFLIGALLVWDAAGGVAEAAANTTNVPVNLAGVSQNAGNNSATLGLTRSVFAPIMPGILIECNFALIGANTLVLTTALIGAVVGFDKRTIGTLHWVATNAHTQAHGRIVGIAKGHAIGDINARVYVAPFSNDIASIKRTSW